MRMDFSRLRAEPLALLPLKGRKIPRPAKKLVTEIINFARYAGLAVIPQTTVEKLKTDPYFKFCFAVFIEPSRVYSRYPSTTIEQRRRLETILQDPQQMTDQDLAIGLAVYLNNFIARMPGGALRIYDFTTTEQPHFMAIDEILQKNSLREKALSLKVNSDEERQQDKGSIQRSYAQEVAYYKLCLTVYDEMIARGFSRLELWT